jgi:hypothetical protein
MNSDAEVIESHPVGLLIVGLTLLVVGVVTLAIPGRVQRIAQKSIETSAVSRYLPFSTFAWDVRYVAVMRAMGVVFLLIGVFFVVVWIAAMSASGPI